ncbi:MAG TPA: DUF924 family protein, partial [Candidatus Binataceae bacterium]|nr:DUF924 family protein [Candidatus Binataceae bacterium]
KQLKREMTRSRLKPSIASDNVSEGRRAESQVERILKFWLLPDRGDDARQLWSRWFVADPEFDKRCRALFLDSYKDAARGRLDGWKETPRSCLALVLLLDQFPRNMFRDAVRAFATDAKARAVSRHAIASGFDRELPHLMRMFFYLPFEHSEDLNDQMESLRLARALADEYGKSPESAAILGSAESHLETIRRFRRFPSRNRALGRHSTKEELEFLRQANAASGSE